MSKFALAFDREFARRANDKLIAHEQLAIAYENEHFDREFARRANSTKIAHVKLSKKSNRILIKQNWKTPVIDGNKTGKYFKAMQVVIQVLLDYFMNERNLTYESTCEQIASIVSGYPRYSDKEAIGQANLIDREIKNLASQPEARQTRRDVKKPLVRKMLIEDGVIV